MWDVLLRMTEMTWDVLSIEYHCPTFLVKLRNNGGSQILSAF